MKRIFIFICVVVLFVASTMGVYLYQQQRIIALEAEKDKLVDELAAAKAIDTNGSSNEPSTPASYTSEKGVGIDVTAPASGSKVISPLEIKGSVPGSWSHEGQFNVRLLDDDGRVLDEEPARLKGDWMTESMVQFSGLLIFTAPDSNTGSLVLVKANPSGLPENDDSLTIPITF